MEGFRLTRDGVVPHLKDGLVLLMVGVTRTKSHIDGTHNLFLLFAFYGHHVHSRCSCARQPTGLKYSSTKYKAGSSRNSFATTAVQKCRIIECLFDPIS